MEQIPAGKGGCEAVGQGVTTDRESGLRGGSSVADDEEAAAAGRPDKSLRR